MQIWVTSIQHLYTSAQDFELDVNLSSFDHNHDENPVVDCCSSRSCCGCLAMDELALGFLLSGLNAGNGAQIVPFSQSRNGGQRVEEDHCEAIGLLRSR